MCIRDNRRRHTRSTSKSRGLGDVYKRQNLSSNAKEAMHQFKMETAREVGVNLKEGYNGDLTSRQAGSIGGEMVRKMIKQAEENL